MSDFGFNVIDPNNNTHFEATQRVPRILGSFTLHPDENTNQLSGSISDPGFSLGEKFYFGTSTEGNYVADFELEFTETPSGFDYVLTINHKQSPGPLADVESIQIVYGVF